jgi:hypothetical protein
MNILVRNYDCIHICNYIALRINVLIHVGTHYRTLHLLEYILIGAVVLCRSKLS